VALTIRTGRGIYNFSVAAPIEREADAIVLTMAAERADGIEKVAFRCRVANAMAGGIGQDELVEKIAHWVEREFEITRELALKTIRSEHKLLEIFFDSANPGPFSA